MHTAKTVQDVNGHVMTSENIRNRCEPRKIRTTHGYKVTTQPELLNAIFKLGNTPPIAVKKPPCIKSSAPGVMTGRSTDEEYTKDCRTPLYPSIRL